ncbi:HpcH/HpaI aldolase/citrate lyase family protein [Pseudomonas citronellolis]|uniref:HpcH/HpaI aldolase/citrate lyase family protein n=1 Tax=Pseudomonas citronellolis TaxID=53408 RepID=UPI0021C17BA8|nr:CoA ester lyase [Pseudomonas citronellolis]UXJ50174.1 CoA ester lyase [Pseudomonas citronellolis]
MAEQFELGFALVACPVSDFHESEVAMRSYLFVPGDRPERFSKALAAKADVVILDLEDAVATSNKPLAREHVRKAVEEGAQVMLRINGFGSPEFADDLALLRGLPIRGVMLPKAETIEPMVELRTVTSAPIIPLIESALGLWQVLTVARAPGVERLAFGSIDFQVDVGCDGSDEALLHARSQIVLVSRVAGLQAPVDGVSVALDDEALIAVESRRSRSLGFAGKLCIHPKQVPVVNQAFSPSTKELDWARRVIAATEQSGGAAVSVDGAMVDLPVLMKAQNLLALAE